MQGSFLALVLHTAHLHMQCYPDTDTSIRVIALLKTTVALAAQMTAQSTECKPPFLLPLVCVYCQPDCRLSCMRLPPGIVKCDISPLANSSII